MDDMKVCGGRPRDALVHPLFWVALSLLVVNDHILKRAHLLPGVVTGKLSDFSGLLIAPVLVVALLQVRMRIGRVAVFVCVAGLFAALKLSRTCADVVEHITAYTPVPWRVWCDPTDLVALAVLPLGWWLTTREGESAGGPRLGLCLRAAGLVLGIFACAATSATTERYRGTAFLFNGTMRTQTLSVYRLQSLLDCSRSIEAPADWPGRAAFVLQSCLVLSPGDILPLDQGWKALGGDDGLGAFSVDTDFDAGIMGRPAMRCCCRQKGCSLS